MPFQGHNICLWPDFHIRRMVVESWQPVTAVQDCLSTFVIMKRPGISEAPYSGKRSNTSKNNQVKTKLISGFVRCHSCDRGTSPYREWLEDGGPFIHWRGISCGTTGVFQGDLRTISSRVCDDQNMDSKPKCDMVLVLKPNWMLSKDKMMQHNDENWT